MSKWTLAMNYDLNDSLLHQLHRASQHADKLFSHGVGCKSLTPRQFIVLLAVAATDGANQASIVDQTGIDKSTLADLMKRLANAGLVLRKRTKADARVYSIEITKAGREAIQAATDGAQEVDELLLAKLPQDRRKQFTKELALLLA